LGDGPLKRSKILFWVLPLLGLSLGCQKSPTGPLANQWTKVTGNAFSGGRYGLTGTVYNGQMWAVGGASGSPDGSVTYYYSDVYSSTNGGSWTKVNANAPFGGRYGSQLLSYNGQLWLIGGNNNGTLMNDVWNSTDGKTWNEVLISSPTATATQFSPREDFCALVYNNAMWVIAGFTNGICNNDVWTSTNGSAWTQVMANGPPSATQFATRWGDSGVVYNNMMWIMAGAHGNDPNSDPDTAYGDVWSSTTGNSWNLVSNLEFPLIYYNQVVPFNNQLYLTEGELWNNWGPQNWVLSSNNGINWNSSQANYPIRFGHLSLSYNNSIWVIAGCDDVCTTLPCPTTVTYYNDVWRNP
jgi:hypothetical protein